MSRIYFHAEDDQAEVRGSERALMGVLTGDIAAAVLASLKYSPDRLRALLPASADYLAGVKDSALWEPFLNYLRHGDLMFEGQQHDAISIALNTAIVLGGDPLILYARVHGQCEIHGYVEGPNRSWLAGIIEGGLATGLYRSDSGWDSVVAMLRSRSDGPVVTSYSVCDQFPNSYVAGVVWDEHDPERSHRDQVAWDGLPTGEQWVSALAGLRGQNKDRRLEWKPEGWREFRFEGPSMFDILRIPGEGEA